MHTWLNYAHDLRVFFTIVALLLEHIDRQSCARFMEHQTRAGLSSLTINRRLATISSLFTELHLLSILYAIRHIPRATRRARVPLKITVRPLLRGRLGQVLLGVSFFETANVATTLLILRATQLLAPSLGVTTATEVAIGLYAGYNAAPTVASLPAGRMSDRWGPIGVLMGGVFFFLVAYLGFAVSTPGIGLLAASFVVAGLAIGCIETSEHTAVAALAPSDLRGSAFGLLATVQSFGNIIASGIAGLLWTLLSPTVAFVYLAVWALLSCVVLAQLALRPLLT